MQLVEQHVINRHDPRYSVIDEAAFKSKNLYNAALYEIRQAFIHEGKYLNYTEMDRRMQSHEAYKALPAKVSQQVLVLLDKHWTAFFKAKAAYEEDPSKFTGRPRLLKYKHKTECRNILKTHTLTDIGSGLGTGRKGLQKVQGDQVAEVMVTCSDRFTRRGLTSLQTLCSGSGVMLTVLAADEDKTPEEALTQDLLVMIASFAGRLYGLRLHQQKQFLACAEQVMQAKDGT
jgi:Resolvase, N terminal domain